MVPSRAARIEHLFHEAYALEPAARQKLLTDACAGDAALRAEVEALLRAHAGAEEFFGELRAEAASLLASHVDGDEQSVGRLVGPYRIVRPLGAGGMGTVYLAERADGQFGQEVALKLIRRGMDTNEIIARFRTERQILARLQHPNIARLLDGGITDDGLPWFAMERISGETITSYCAARHSTIRERLALFVSACEAVQYAHVNLVVHRDLKPDNILVQTNGRVSLLDFGIAKVLDPGNSGDSTSTGVRAMTPRYAAPEQALGLPITTATDVYGLGVVLFELLTGQLPFERPPDAGTGAITPREPPRPSNVAPSQRRQLAGDLDNICMKALHWEPERRYGSAAELAEDVGRHLRGLPVAALPDTLAYRTRKFVGRHRAGLTLAATGIVLAFGSVSFHSVRLADERDRARSAATRAERVSAFMAEVFSFSDPMVARGRSVTAREMLDRGARVIETELNSEPEVQADLMTLMGRVYRSSSLYTEAAPLLEKALAVRRRVGAPDSAIAAVLDQLASVRREVADHAGADTLIEQALTLYRRRRQPDDLAVATALSNLGDVRRWRGNFASSESLFVQALALQRRFLGSAHRDIANTLNNLALVVGERGDAAAGERMHREALAMRLQVLGEDHPEYSNSLNNLAGTLAAQERLAEAEGFYREALRLRVRLLGTDDSRTLNTQKNLARTLHLRGGNAEAERLLNDALARLRRRLGAAHPWIADGMRSLALVLAATARADSGVTVARASLAMNARLLGAEHPITLANAVDAAWVMETAGDMRSARQLYESAIKAQARVVPNHPVRTVGLERLGTLLRRLGEDSAGRQLLDEAKRVRNPTTAGDLPR